MWPSVTFGGKADQHTIAAIAKAISKRRTLLLQARKKMMKSLLELVQTIY